MESQIRNADGVAILDIGGKLSLNDGSSLQLREKIRGLVQSGHKKILLDLSDVSSIDSSGIGELVAAYASVANQGGSLKLLGLTRKVHELLSITKLLTVFESFDNEAQALRSFK